MEDLQYTYESKDNLTRRERKFQHRNSYNINDGTIQTDIKNDNGENIRVQFAPNLDNNVADARDDILVTYRGDPKQSDNYTISMSKKSINRHPAVANTILKHEEGHIANKMYPERFKKIKDEIIKLIQTYDSQLHDHGKNYEEYIADLYSVKHSGYGKRGFNKFIKYAKKCDDSTRDILKRFKDDLLCKIDPKYQEDIDKIIDKMQPYYNQLDELENDIYEGEEILKYIKNSDEYTKDDIRKVKTKISDIKKDVKTVASILKKFEKDIESIKSAVYKKHKDEVKSQLSDEKNRIKDDKARIKHELAIRKKFIKDNYDKSIIETVDFLLDVVEAHNKGYISESETVSLVSNLGKCDDELYEESERTEIERAKEFLRRHKYDPKTKTIESDIIDKKTGKKKRIKLDVSSYLNIVAGNRLQGFKCSKIAGGKICIPYQTMIRDKNIADAVLKHEEGHKKQDVDPTEFDKMKKEIQDMLDKYSGKLNSHGELAEEYYADLYAARTISDNPSEYTKCLKELYHSYGILNDILDIVKVKILKLKPTEEDIKKCIDEINNLKKIRNDVLKRQLKEQKKEFQKVLNDKMKPTVNKRLSYKDAKKVKEKVCKIYEKQINDIEQNIAELDMTIQIMKSKLRNIRAKIYVAEKLEKRTLKESIKAINSGRKEFKNEIKLRTQFVNDNFHKNKK